MTDCNEGDPDCGKEPDTTVAGECTVDEAALEADIEAINAMLSDALINQYADELFYLSLKMDEAAFKTALLTADCPGTPPGDTGFEPTETITAACDASISMSTAAQDRTSALADLAR